MQFVTGILCIHRCLTALYAIPIMRVSMIRKASYLPLASQDSWSQFVKLFLTFYCKAFITGANLCDVCFNQRVPLPYFLGVKRRNVSWTLWYQSCPAATVTNKWQFCSLFEEAAYLKKILSSNEPRAKHLPSLVSKTEVVLAGTENSLILLSPYLSPRTGEYYVQQTQFAKIHNHPLSFNLPFHSVWKHLSGLTRHVLNEMTTHVITRSSLHKSTNKGIDCRKSPLGQLLTHSKVSPLHQHQFSEAA